MSCDRLNTVSLVGSVSRRAGGLFESVRRLHQELLSQGPPAEHGNSGNGSPIRHTDVSVLGLRDEFTEVDRQAWPPVRVQTFDVLGPRSFGYAPWLLDRTFELAPDLVHVHGLWQFPAVVATRWHLRSGRPYIVSPHGMLDAWALKNAAWKKSLAWVFYQKAHLKAASCLRALCAAEAEAIRASGFGGPVCIVPNGVDLPELNRTGHRSEAWLPGRRVLLYLGRIHPKKGLEPLLKAWAEVRKQAGEWVLVIAGWDQLGHEADLKALCRRTSLGWTDARDGAAPAGAVVFAGPQFGADKHRWLRRCDAFVLPSLGEGLPMAVLEAWAFSKPVLISPQCNLNQGISLGAAIQIAPGTEQIARGLLQLFHTSAEVLRSMGERGRDLVASQFTWRKAAADLREVYHWILGIARKPGCVIGSRSHEGEQTRN